MTRRILQILLPLAVLIAGALGAKSLIDRYEAPVAAAPIVEPPFVRAITAEAENIRLSVTAEGTVRPRVESELVPEVAGRVIWVSPSLAIGGFFEEGDEMLKIDPREYELAVTRSRAAVAQAATVAARPAASRTRAVMRAPTAAAGPPCRRPD